MAVLLETSIGDLVIDLKVDDCPKACTNFIKLCKMKHYNNCLFHSVQKDFIAQTGDPTNMGRVGTSVFGKLPGSKKKFFDDEIFPTVKHNVKGTVAMANERPNENGSSFYITLRDKIESLDGKHTIFGTIAEGLEVLDKMNNTMVDEKSAPFQNIRIWHTEILEDPYADPEGLEGLIPPKSPEVIKDEEFKKIEGEVEEAELNERMAKTLAKSQATNLEILHDIPDADIAPPDSDLFIYKLNPITQDGDLELIFSRFGPIRSCEIVRDWKTGDSLQYAFVIFENVRDCEEAYFKMHDCVIDDRRIGVNFSQSVAKMWNKWRTGSRMSKEDLDNAEGKGKHKGGKGGGKGKGKGKGEKGKGKGDTTPIAAPAPEAPRGSNGGGRHELLLEQGSGSRGAGRKRSPSPRRRSESPPRQRRRSPRKPSPVASRRKQSPTPPRRKEKRRSRSRGRR